VQCPSSDDPVIECGRFAGHKTSRIIGEQIAKPAYLAGFCLIAKWVERRKKNTLAQPVELL
jgi:hypothetical protein